ncbi:MAG TPA: hypothetical protein VNL70_08490 [Tepidisphaeraceae bacterium]|nr:hypothetical protein [Tepidisphaeraceae bacterium]
MPATQRKRESPTYVKPGIEREMQLRVGRPIRADLEHVHRLISRQLEHPPSLGVFIAVAASVGADDTAAELKLGPALKLKDDLAQELAARMHRPLKQELLQHYQAAYRGLPPASFGEYVVYVAARGAKLLRDFYVIKGR